MIFRLIALLALVSRPVSAALTEVEFLAVIRNFEIASSRFTAVYLPKQSYVPVNHYWSYDWKDYHLGATPSLGRNREAMIEVAGWVARIPQADADAIDLVLCHEMGHHMTPPLPPAQIYTTERYADDFAVRSCLPIIWESGFSVERVRKAATYSWELRVYSRMQGQHRAFDPKRCTIDLMVKAAKGEEIPFKEIADCERGI